MCVRMRMCMCAYVYSRVVVQGWCSNINVQTSFPMLPNCNGNVMFSLNLHFAFGIVIFIFIIKVLSIGKYRTNELSRHG